MKNKIPAIIARFFRGTFFKRSKKGAVSTNNTSSTEEYERCVICGRLTGIPISMPVDWRENYEIGIGQICTECAKKAEFEANGKNSLSHKQILMAVQKCKNKNNK